MLNPLLKILNLALPPVPPAQTEILGPLPQTDVLSPDFNAGSGYAPMQHSFYDGEKFPGGFGPTQVFTMDYWTMRARSEQVFTENLYAKGIVRRLVTNIVNTGLQPEASPDEDILGLEEDSLADWAENVENRFFLWGKNPQACDWKREATFGAIQRTVERESIISGDILVVLRQSRRTRLPVVQLISGSDVQTPLGGQPNMRSGNEIRHGVEFDSQNRVVAHWVTQDDGTSKRIPAFGEKSGRKISWLEYGSEKRIGGCRGEPLLAVILQSLKEIDRYRDSTQRKALLNSLIAMQVIKKEDMPGTLPISGGALRRDDVSLTDSDGSPRTYNLASMIPGLVIEEMQTGEEIKMMGGDGTDVNFGPFEEVILSGIAWSLEMPPEILKLAFSNNYSASQAAINEFKIMINLKWGDRGETFCTPIYNDWLISEVLLQKVDAPGLLEAWRDQSEYDIFGAWTLTAWYGSIKPSTDMLKQAKGSKMLVDEGWSTNAREARITTGTKFSKNIKKLARENKLKAEAIRPMLELKSEFGPDQVADAADALDGAALALVETLENIEHGEG